MTRGTDDHDRLRIALVGSTLFTDGIAALLDQGGMHARIVGAGATHEAVDLVRTTAADVLVIELRPTGGHDLAALRAVMSLTPRPRTVLVCNACSPARIAAAVAAGGDAYLVPEGGAATIRQAIEAVMHGERYVGPFASELLQQRRRASGRLRAGARVPSAPTLTAREAEILDHLARGMTGPQIARKLGLSASTIHVHRTRIMRKLGAHNSAQLIRVAIERGLIDVGFTGG